MATKKIEKEEIPTIDTVTLDIEPETPQVVSVPPKEPTPASQVVEPQKVAKQSMRVPNLKCPNCAWIGGDTELKNKSYLNERSPFFKSCHANDLFCPTCGDRVIEGIKAKEDPTYQFYGYDFENRVTRIIAREVRARALDPDAYDATRRRELAKHGINVPRN